LKDKLIKLYADYSKNKYEILKLSNELFGNQAYNKYYNETSQKILTYAEIVKTNNENLKNQLFNVSEVSQTEFTKIKYWTFDDIRTYTKLKNKQLENLKHKQNGRVNEH